jgi:glycosyltransferase involved in cell wall biosynthesis
MFSVISHRKQVFGKITPVMQIPEPSGQTEPGSGSPVAVSDAGCGRLPRRVFFLLDSFMIGGTETQAVELARRLDPACYQVTVGCLRKEGPLLSRLDRTRVRVVEFSMGKGIDSPSGISGVLKLAGFLRRERIQVMHAHDLWSNLVGMVAAKLARVPVTITSQRDLSHDAWYGTYRRRVLRYLQSRSSIVLTNAKAIRDGLIEKDKLPPEKVCVIYNGVDIDRFRSVIRNREGMFPDSTGRKLVILVGNMNSDVKGHPVLISAAVEVVKQHPEVQFLLVGDGPKRRDFEALVESAGLKQRLFFLGRRNDVPQILASCDIAVLPSLAEGLPNAVLEYLASGLPVVATALGGNLEVIQDGVTGLLFPPKDANALAAALNRLLGDPQFAAQLAKAGREHVTTNFSFEHLVTEVNRLYTRLLNRQAVESATRVIPLA